MNVRCIQVYPCIVRLKFRSLVVWCPSEIGSTVVVRLCMCKLQPRQSKPGKCTISALQGMYHIINCNQLTMHQCKQWITWTHLASKPFDMNSQRKLGEYLKGGFWLLVLLGNMLLYGKLGNFNVSGQPLGRICGIISTANLVPAKTEISIHCSFN